MQIVNMAAPASGRYRSRRRVAAFNFLSNISLDGSHHDTKYDMFNKKGMSEAGAVSEQLHNREEEDAPTQPAASYAAAMTLPTTPTVDQNKLERPRDASCKGRTSSGIAKSREWICANTVSDLFEIMTSVGETSNKATDSSPPKRHRACSYSGEKHPITHLQRLNSCSISGDDTPTETDTTNLSTDYRKHSTSVSMAARSRNYSVSSSSSVGSVTKLIAREVCFIKPDSDRVFRKERIVLISTRQSPFVIYSALPYCKRTQNAVLLDHPDGGRLRRSSMSGSGSITDNLMNLGLHSVADGQYVSYSQFLVPSRCRLRRMISQDAGSILQPIAEATQSSPDSDTGELVYHPDLLDDPELRSGRHRTLMTFPSYMTSVIDYVRPSDLKKELNEKFREMFPLVQLSLSKLRSLKRDMHRIAHGKCGIDLWTVAETYVFFEKIILKNLITKSNRKLVAGACLLLSAKLNDIKGADLTELLQEVEETFRLHRKDLLAFECGVLVALEFSLHLPDKDIYPYYQRLLFSF